MKKYLFGLGAMLVGSGLMFVLIFTLGCDFKHGKDKSEISGAEKPKQGIAAFRSKLGPEENADQEPTVKNSPLDKEEEKRRKLFEDMKRK